MKVVFICFYEAYPPTSGAASVTYNMAKYTQGKKMLLQIGREDRTDILADDFSVVTIKGPNEGRWKKLFGISKLVNILTDRAAGFSPDAVVLEGASWVFYLYLLAKRIKERNPHVRQVYHAHNVEYVLRRQKHSWPVVRITGLAEQYLFKASDISTVVSEVDRDHVRSLYGLQPIILPNGVDLGRFDEVTDSEIAAVRNKYGVDENTVLFMGFYGYKPNQEGIDFLVKNVIPDLAGKYPLVKLAVIGSVIPYQKSWLISPGIIHYGELPAFVKACGVGVAPIFSGSGTRLKILEYMAAGIPVVSTAKGAEGLDIIDGNNILIAEEAVQFGEAIARLLSNSTKSQIIVENSFKLVGSVYSWDVIMNRFNKILQSSGEKD